MTAELKKSKKSLADTLKGQHPPEFDAKLYLTSILSYITKIKRSTHHSTLETTRKTQKMNFLEALSDFQLLLKAIKKTYKNYT